MSMGGGFGGGGGGGGFASSFRKDASVTDHHIAKGTTRRVAGYARPYIGQIVAFLLINVVSSLLVVATPLLLQRIIDDGVVNQDVRLVIILASLVAVVAIVEAVLGLVQRWFSSRIGEGLIYNLRTDVFDHVQRQSIAFFTRTQTGSLVTRLNTDVIGAQQAFTSTLSALVSNVVTLAAVLITMLALSWQITLISLAVVPLILLPARRVGRRLAGLRREAMGYNAEMGSMMTERFNVAGALLVKLFGSPEREHSEFASRAEAVRGIGVKQAMSNRVFFTALGAMASIATALVYGVGGVLAIREALTVGTLVAFAGLLGRLYGPVTALSNVQVDVMTALVSFERVFEVLDLEPMVKDAPDARLLPEGPIGVSLDDVTFTYPSGDEVSLLTLESPKNDREPKLDPAPDAPLAKDVGHSSIPKAVLRDVTFDVPAGQMVALVGPSGAGKSTVTSLVTRLYDANEGTVSVGGVDVRHLAAESLRGAIGVVTQDSHLFHATIRENLAYARPDATTEQMWSALDDAQIGTFVRRLPDGLDTIVGDRGHRLSGGEKQRIAIARVLLRAPRIVILDEATAHLDSESEAAVQRALDTAMEGRTSLVIAHRLSTVRAADRIVVLERGAVVEQGTHAELLATGGLYSELHHTQFAE
ncbi:MAG TPA: ABC transporter ATP-binding protein [Actinomycetales bacterium]|nr:ABC transporter ATP-binding protein [Actinomycetales bacterium]